MFTGFNIRQKKFLFCCYRISCESSCTLTSNCSNDLTGLRTSIVQSFVY